MFNVDTIKIRLWLKNSGLRTAARIHVLRPIGIINSFHLLALCHNLCATFEEDHIIPITCVDYNPCLVRQVFCLLQIPS